MGTVYEPQRRHAAVSMPASVLFRPKEGQQMKGQQMKVLELFAGIGGWRLSLPELFKNNVDVTAYDSGEWCRQVYKSNFHEECFGKNIESLTKEHFDGFDVWLMSPPCQPFTKTLGAKQLDTDDRRCRALAHITNLLLELESPPAYIALENVKGFYGSAALDNFQKSLAKLGFTWAEFVVDPANCGRPNHRSRYYLLAERSDRFSDNVAESNIDQKSAVGNNHSFGQLLELRSIFGGQKNNISEGAGEKIIDLGSVDWDSFSFEGKEILICNSERTTEIVKKGHALARRTSSPKEKRMIFAAMRYEVAYVVWEELVRVPPFDEISDMRDFNHTHIEAFVQNCIPPDERFNRFLDLWGAADFKAILREDTVVLHFETPPTDDFKEHLKGLLKIKSQSLFTVQSASETCEKLENFLESDEFSDHLDSTTTALSKYSEDDKKQFLLTEEVLGKPYAKGLSVVSGSDRQTFCFTGHYGKVIHKSSGSLLLADHEESIARTGLDRANMVQYFGKMRKFTPTEILNIFGFPKEFKMPSLKDLSLQRQYKCVGNSVSVFVCSRLLQILFFGELDESDKYKVCAVERSRKKQYKISSNLSDASTNSEENHRLDRVVCGRTMIQGQLVFYAESEMRKLDSVVLTEIAKRAPEENIFKMIKNLKGVVDAKLFDDFSAKLSAENNEFVVCPGGRRLVFAPTVTNRGTRRNIRLQNFYGLGDFVKNIISNVKDRIFDDVVAAIIYQHSCAREATIESGWPYGKSYFMSLDNRAFSVLLRKGNYQIEVVCPATTVLLLEDSDNEWTRFFPGFERRVRYDYNVLELKCFASDLLEHEPLLAGQVKRVQDLLNSQFGRERVQLTRDIQKERIQQLEAVPQSSCANLGFSGLN